MITVELVEKVIETLTPSILGFLIRHKDDGVFIQVYLMNQSEDSHEAIISRWIQTNPNGVRSPDFETATKHKAKYTLRTGQCSRETALDGAHLVDAGDIIWPGSVNWNGLVVSTSGASDAMLDEGISNIVAAAIMMECQTSVNRLRKQDVWSCPSRVDHL